METYDSEPKESTSSVDAFEFTDTTQVSPIEFFKSKNIVILDNVLTEEECVQILEIPALHNLPMASNSYKSRSKWCFNFQDLSDIVSKRCLRYIPPSEYIPCDLPRQGHHNDVDHWYYAEINKAWRLVNCYPGSSINEHLDTPYICGVDCKSIYTVMVYLTDNSDGETIIGDVTCAPRRGRVLLFNQDLAHHGSPNTLPKSFIRSEIMYTRAVSTETSEDKEAMELYKQAYTCYNTDPLESKRLESQAFTKSPKLENVFYS